MNVRQHSCDRGECPGLEASDVFPMRFNSVGKAIDRPTVFASTVVWQKIDSICAARTRY